VYKFLKGVSDSVVEAINYLIENPEATNMIADCAEAVLAIKNTLETNKEDSIEAIDKFLVKSNIIAETIEKGQDYINEINELLNIAITINEHCKNNIEYKFRIVFFAELGSKWDSMDSVYRAYKSRKDCDVAVVIAPIFRAMKMPNGEIKSDVIYNDYLTEMGIEHIPFQQYDIKKDRPDMVFTSQPYESVTLEMFWAENIAPYTRLVYLPYYTSASMETEEQKLVQCQMPMHKLAWKMVCQSDRQKEIYSKYMDNKGKNLVSSGLPKWDWPVNNKNRNIELPKGWEKLKGKKVVLRNIHYGAVGNFCEDTKENKIIRELKRITEVHEGTDIGYIYRFHPMTETIFKLYYPEYLKAWEDAKAEVQASGNVVIDTNESYDYAFKFSDVFVTELTSLIPQYLFTQKPVILCFWGKSNERLEIEKKEECFIPYAKLYSTNNILEIYKIRDEIFNGEDIELEYRLEFIKKYLPNADGKIGERLSKYFIDEILKEDNIL